MADLVDTPAESWTVSYQPTKGSTWIETELGAPTDLEAWRLWVMWRTVHFVVDFYAVQAFPRTIIQQLLEARP